MEAKYSKRTSCFIAIDSFINTEETLVSSVTSCITDWLGSVNGSVSALLTDHNVEFDPKEVAIELFIQLLLNPYEMRIQKIATSLGRALGFREIPVASRIGAEILGFIHTSNLSGKLFDMAICPETNFIMISPNVSLSIPEKRELKKLRFLPPNTAPALWTSNSSGGFAWESKSALCGKGTHHEDPISLDVLNKLQAQPYTLDLETLVAEKKLLSNQDGWNEVIGDYIEEDFYFTYRFDSRGRMYASGYDISPMGDDLAKALVIPSVAYKCTDEALSTLKDHILDLEPGVLRRKAIRAYRKAEKGIPINYQMEIDASSSGAQMLSVLSGCMQTAKLCNLTSAPKNDLYQAVLDEMVSLGCNGSYTRKQTKKSIMTSLYNSQATPKKVFKSDVDIFWKSMTTCCPGAMEAMDCINSCMDPSATERSWVMPDGHHVRVPVRVSREERIHISSLGSRMTIQYKEKGANPEDLSLVANLTHSVDSFVLREVIRRADFPINPLHDAFFIHPNHVAATKALYREVMAEVASMNLLDNIASQLCNQSIDLKITGRAALSAEILKSNYALV